MKTPSILDCDIGLLRDEVVRATDAYEFDSFVLGIERPPEYSREDHEAEFRDVKIRLGNMLAELWPDRSVEFERPELRIDLAGAPGGVAVKLQPVPLFIGGRYRKLSREIPACRWAHLKCKGKGCPSCGYTGNICGPSLQELAEPAILEATGGAETFFHGAGREDVDVRMLGYGRPCVFEIRHPRRRRFDLAMLCRAINDAAREYAEVHRLALTTRDAIVQAKSAEAEKTYRAWIEVDGALPADLEARFASLSGATIEQLSPKRVMKRRGRDTLRVKRVVESTYLGEEDGVLLWEVRTSSGAYIKELVSGDDGRTKPSVSSILGVPCRCALLDVLDVHWTPPWEE